MEIELPDGTVLDAPDGSDPRKVVHGYKLAKMKASDPSEYDSESPEFKEKYGTTSGMSTSEKLKAGYISGLNQGGRGITHLLVKTMNALSPQAAMYKKLTGRDLNETPEFASEDAIRAQNAKDKDLGDTGAGFVGQLGGQVASTLPLSVLTGGAGTAATGLGTVGRVATSAPVRNAVEGAINSAIFAEPGEEGGAAAEGAGLGTAFGVLGRTGKRLFRGLVTKSQAAQDLEHLAHQAGEELDIPLSQAADEGGGILTRTMKTLYREGLPYIPGVSGKLGRQAEEAGDTVRKMAIGEAAPEGFALSAAAGREPQIAQKGIKAAFDTAYKDIKDNTKFEIPAAFRSNMMGIVRGAIPTIDKTNLGSAVTKIKEIVNQYSHKPGRMHGENVFNAKEAMSQAIGEAKGAEKQALIALQKEFHEVIRSNVNRDMGSSGLTAFDELTEPYRNFKAVNKAINKAAANEGRFSPAQLAQSAGNNAQMKAMGGTANTVLKQSVAKPSTAGRALTMVGGAALAKLAVPIPIAALIGANVMATKTFQKALMGDLKMQQRLLAAAANNPAKLNALKSVFKNAATTEAGDQYGTP